MVDREKVIRLIEEEIDVCEIADQSFGTIDLQELRDILALLKEQKKQKFMVDSDGKITPLPDVVRCKDCKNAVVYDDNEVICTHIDSNGNDKHSIDWYCADGQRRETV